GADNGPAHHPGAAGILDEPPRAGPGDDRDRGAVGHAERTTDVVGSRRLVHADHRTHRIGQYPGREGSTSRVHASMPPSRERTPSKPDPRSVDAARADRTPDLQ